MSGRESDDGGVRFVFVLGPTNAPTEPKAKPDVSFRIAGQISDPAKPQPAFPERLSPELSDTSPSETSDIQSNRELSRPRANVRHQLVKLSVRIPVRHLDALEEISRETNRSWSRIVRDILSKALRRRRRLG